jgi:hypothetical protein
MCPSFNKVNIIDLVVLASRAVWNSSAPSFVHPETIPQMWSASNLNLLHLPPLVFVRRWISALCSPFLLVCSSPIIQQLLRALLGFDKSDEGMFVRWFVCVDILLASGRHFQRTVELVFG